jgi:hypothetical protein
MKHKTAMDDKKSILDETEKWPQISFPMPKIENNTKQFNTTNRAKTKVGLFSYPSNVLTLVKEEDYSIEMFDHLICLGDEANIDFGVDYGKQQDSVIGGIKGIIHWYVCQYFKTNTLSSSDTVTLLPLKAVYIVEGKKLFLGSVFKLLSRQTQYPHYSIIGQIICTYIEWCTARQNNDFAQLDRLAHVLFGLGTEMAKAEHERKIIAGNSRTNCANDKKRRTRN